MARISSSLLILVILAQHCSLGSALGSSVGGRVLRGRQNVPQDAADLRSKLSEAVHEALGADNGIHHERLADIHKAISPMWRSLVKNRYGLVGLRTMRYAVHRYLLQTYAISFVGLEPHQSNATLSQAQILTHHAPDYVSDVLKEKAEGHGFSIEDVVALIATLESLVADEGRDMLESAFRKRDHLQNESISREEFSDVQGLFMTNWIFSRDSWDDQDPDEWSAIVAFNQGHLKSFEYNRLQSLQTKRPWSQGSSWTPLEPQFSFEDASLVADSMQKSFGDYSSWFCSAVKETLVAKDAKGTGRVRMGDFHKDALDGNIHFGESKAYLREMGVLDETSPSLGPQVIITNYLQAASNCIVNTPHYRVCCQNECEGIFAELEEAIGGPLATPGQLLAVIGNMTGSLEEDRVTIDSYLVNQLEAIARASQGKVPLHGRLFAQWLHYAFPHECPFPHKEGTISARASHPPGKTDSEHLATESEMAMHVEEGGEQADEGEIGESTEWMSQWTPEEELLADYAHLRAPWEVVTGSALIRPMLLLLVGIVVVGYKYSHRQSGAGLKDLDLPICAGKAHYI